MRKASLIILTTALALSSCVRYTETYSPAETRWYQRPIIVVHGQPPDVQTLARREGKALQATPACFTTFALEALANITGLITLWSIPGIPIILTSVAVHVAQGCGPVE